MIRHRALWVLLLVGRALCANAQAKIEVRDAGPGVGAIILAHALAGRYTVVGPATVTYAVSRDSILDGTIIVLKRDVVVSGSVRGDVIVIGGDLYMDPGGRIDGRAIAMGGGVYESTLASIGAGTRVYNDFTYDVESIPGGYALKYHAANDRPLPTLSLPGLYGFLLPTYDRTNGLSIAVAPRLVIPEVGTRIEPKLSYRSQLGVVDPYVVLAQPISRVVALHGEVGRGTFSNDTWIRGNLVNSAAVLWSGNDARNYYRATRAEASVSRLWQTATSTVEPFLGGRWERAHSVRPDASSLGGPWSVRERHDPDDMLRPNPQFIQNNIGSAIGGARASWADNGLVALVTLVGEVGGSRQDCDACESSTRQPFQQVTLDGGISFPTFNQQALRVNAHIVASHGETPVQRFAYVGGPGTIPSLKMLERGGGDFLFFDAGYDIPLNAVTLPLGLSPLLTLREVLAGADVSSMPQISQLTGARLAVSVLYVEMLFDPVHRRGYRRHLAATLIFASRLRRPSGAATFENVNVAAVSAPQTERRA